MYRENEKKKLNKIEMKTGQRYAHLTMRAEPHANKA